MQCQGIRGPHCELQYCVSLLAVQEAASSARFIEGRKVFVVRDVVRCHLGGGQGVVVHPYVLRHNLSLW